MSSVQAIEEALHGSLQHIADALIACNASDLHITPDPKGYSVRARCHGHLNALRGLSTEHGRGLVQTFKAAGKMNIAETRRPQDGRLSLPHAELRLACHPSLHGENLVVRVLARQSAWSLNSLGFCPKVHSDIEHMLAPSQGLVLVSGPTGSGKTTTLHAMIQSLGAKAGRIATLEDPVEIINPQALQTDLSRLPHLDFAAGLRSLMRQDPDTILVGEIRDEATAELTLHAALTGHRVFASIHAGDCLGTLCRLLELQVAWPSLLNCLNGVLNQRLMPGNPGAQRVIKAQSLWMGQLPRHRRASLVSMADIHSVYTLQGDLNVD
ncbi:GspE/PulE family protein [Limnobacter sp.]|uniref:GspE/PulE family protein n=1 Tax=Limnobacter sp. TaxID=2003368 RepID=UPI0035170017